MTQSVDYNKFAHRWRELMGSGMNHAHRYLEKPAMSAKLPDLSGKRVLALGCGTGEECAALLDRGAALVTGVDQSEAMLALARDMFGDEPRVGFACMDMHRLGFTRGSFDFVYSSLAMHYVRDWDPVLISVREAMTPGARLLLSTHHPMLWGAEIHRGPEADSVLLGYCSPRNESEPLILHGDYFTTRLIRDRWFDEFDVAFYHKPFSEILRQVREAGFVLLDLVEPQPADEARAAAPGFYAVHSRMPLFMILELAIA